MATFPQVILCRTLLVRCIFYAPSSGGLTVLLGMLLETFVFVFPQESLDEVTIKDTLEGDNMYTCSQCGKKVRAEKR